MTFRLRSRRETCLRSPRGALLAVAGVVALATAPAAAAEPEFLKPLGWYADEATAPASVNFNDVAAAADSIVAVGTTSTGAPAIYSRTGGGWQAAPVDPPLPTAGSLDDVVLGEGTGWVVGTAGPADARTPLVLELSAGVWTNRSAATAGPALPTAVTLNGSGAIIGDAGGTIHWVAPGGGQLQDDEKLTGAGQVNGISLLFEGSPRLAVADYDYLVAEQAADNGVRIYELGDPSLLDADEQADTSGVDMTGLAALSSNQAVATDSEGRTWRLTRASGQNDWKQGNSPPVEAGVPELADVASVKGGPSPYDGDAWATEFLAGQVAGAGAIWHRTRWTTDAEAWNPDPLPAGTPALRGVAATEWNAAWAVGSGGTILRYWRPPDPEARAAWLAEQEQQQQQQQQTGTQSPTTGETQTQTQTQTQERQTSTVTLKQWQPSDSPLEPGEDRILTDGVVVTDGEGTVPTRKRIVKNVKAIFRRKLSGRRKLIVKFRLTRRAKVRVAAKRGRKVIARTPLRTMRRGRRKVVLRIRGKTPPSSLKIVARRAPRKT